MPVMKKPSTIVQHAGYCGGCGHGIVQRLIAECIQDLGLQDRTISVVDIACCFWSLDALNFDGIAGPHGRCAAVATAVKKVRPDANVYIHAGDGASYGIGLLETTYAALRDIPVTMIVVNNGLFGMTGGQMNPGTTLLSQKTTSSPEGRNRQQHGMPSDFLKGLSEHDIQYAARGALYNAAEIRKTKSYIKRGFKYQMDMEGFSIIEVLSPCPTNWGMTPLEADDKIEREIAPVFKPGIYLDRG